MKFWQFKAIVVDKLKRLWAVPFGISDPSSDGWPRGIDRTGALRYFEDKYNGQTLPVLVTLLNLSHKRVVSIGSGFGGEEMRIGMLGNNEVHCIEPDGPSCEFHAECQKALPTANVVLHPMTLKQFVEKESSNYHEAFDVIYTSGPGDWMRGDFRDVLPEAYANFINYFGAPQGVVVFKLYGGSHDRFVLDSSWFLRSLVNLFAERTKYRVAGYWTTGRGTALLIAHTAATKLPPMPAELPLARTTAKLKYPSENVSISTSGFDALIPYAIAGVKTVAFVTGQLKKVVRRLVR